MKSPIKLLIIFAASLFLLTSCTNMKSAKMLPDTMTKDLGPEFLAGEVSSKVDGWVLLMDASLSMNKRHGDYVKFDIAKNFVERMNNTLPPISAESGLRTFGHAPQLSDKQTELFYGMSEFDRGQMRAGLSQVTQPGGPTPMSAAIKAATADLKNIQGNKALIIVSDGEDLDDRPVMAAKELLAELGDEACIYTVHVGNDKKGQQLMENIASLSSCGFMVSALDIVPADPMANYVSKVFLSKDTGLGYHKPPATIKSLTNIHFKFDDHQLTQEGKFILNENIKALINNPGIKLTIEGHTSAKGPEEYNQHLSEKRASIVKNYLTSEGNISADRLNAVGFGESRPRFKEADPDEINSVEAKSNMRVEFKVAE